MAENTTRPATMVRGSDGTLVRVNADGLQVADVTMDEVITEMFLEMVAIRHGIELLIAAMHGKKVVESLRADNGEERWQ